MSAGSGHARGLKDGAVSQRLPMCGHQRTKHLHLHQSGIAHTRTSKDGGGCKRKSARPPHHGERPENRQRRVLSERHAGD
mmetsp:Transcript_111067/g.201855  ORF Transcript_111067/g.201855 Transcript_111067/m.201855 type:complete len:80 (+) Transcript_111067:134-373(+)